MLKLIIQININDENKKNELIFDLNGIINFINKFILLFNVFIIIKDIDMRV